VPAAASVRVQGTGCVQLQGAGAKLFLNRAGTYAVRDLLASMEQLAAKGVTSALSRSLRYLAAGTAANQGTASGARASNRGKSGDEEWKESSAAVFLEAGQEYLKAGRFDQAIEQFNEALESSTDSETPEIRYCLANATALSGDLRGAWKEIAGLTPGASDEWQADFVLLKAKLLVDSSAYAEAVDWLTANDLAGDAARSQLYFLLLGLGYRGAADDVNARKALGMVVSTAADSDLGRVATELLK